MCISIAPCNILLIYVTFYMQYVAIFNFKFLTKRSEQLQNFSSFAPEHHATNVTPTHLRLLRHILQIRRKYVSPKRPPRSLSKPNETIAPVFQFTKHFAKEPCRELAVIRYFKLFRVLVMRLKAVQ